MGDMDFLGFDAETTQPMGDYSPIPAGMYRVLIMDSTWQKTKTGGQMLVLKFEVIDGEHLGRHLWARLNLVNSSEKAVEIAKGELSAICRAIGVLQPRDTSELHNRPLLVKVVIESRNDNGEPTNRIKSYEGLLSHQKPKPKTDTNNVAAPRPVYSPAQADDDLPF